MKKMLILGSLVLLMVLVFILGCATLPIKTITSDDLPGLKGQWRGSYEWCVTCPSQSLSLEIDENLQGEMAWAQYQGPPKRTQFSGILENGRIEASWGSSGYIHLNLRKGEGKKMKLDGDYQEDGGSYKGRIFLDKM